MSILGSNGSPTVSNMDDLKNLIKSASGEQEAAIAAAKPIQEKTQKKLDEDQANLDSMETPEKSTKLLEQIQSWKPEKQQSDPISAFGSLGSAFAFLASGLTHTPMINALNAGAAAINARKA